jgi:hypothetical protein
MLEFRNELEFVPVTDYPGWDEPEDLNAALARCGFHFEPIRYGLDSWTNLEVYHSRYRNGGTERVARFEYIVILTLGRDATTETVACEDTPTLMRLLDLWLPVIRYAQEIEQEANKCQ